MRLCIFNFDGRIYTTVANNTSRLVIDRQRQLRIMDPNFIIPSLIAIVFSISIHEFCHALLADRLGDSTPAYQGRLTLNPIAHLDPIGSLLIFFSVLSGFGIGWGKPVQFNPWNLKNPRRDAAIISLAGPLSNFIQAVFFALVVKVVPEELKLFFLPFILINLSLGVFNLIPIHPLDGFKVVGGVLPPGLAFEWSKLERYGLILLIFLIFPFFGQSLIGSVLVPVVRTLFSLLTSF